MGGAIGGDESRRGDLHDRLIDEGHVGLRHRRVVVIGEQEPLAADVVPWREPSPKGRVAHLPDEMAPEEACRDASEPAMPEGEEEHLVPQILQGSREPLEAWHATIERAPPRGDRTIMTWQHPRGCALRHQQLPDARLDRRDHLDRRGAGTDDRDALPIEWDRCIPLRRVEAGTTEGVEPRDVRPHRIAERPCRDDQMLGVPGATRRLDDPALRLLIPVGLLHGLVEPEMGEHLLLGGDALEVTMDLR